MERVSNPVDFQFEFSMFFYSEHRFLCLYFFAFLGKRIWSTFLLLIHTVFLRVPLRLELPAVYLKEQFSKTIRCILSVWTGVDFSKYVSKTILQTIFFPFCVVVALL